MTSRFGKTYSRKGGEANSKFDEVFSNKKATLSTKWGETTYKAQLGSKRPLQKPEVVELLKRPRIEDDDSSEDPFGFDSDDESNPVTSHCVPQSEPAEGEASNTPPATTTVPVDNSRNSTATGKQTLSNEGAEKSSQSLYRSKSDSNQKPIAQSSVTETVPKDPYVEWSLIGTQRSSTSTSMDPLQEKDSAEAPEFSRDSQSSSSQDGLSAGMKSAQQEAQAEPVDNLPPSPFLLRPSNTRKYIRPKPNKASDVPDASAACDVKLPVAASVPAALKPNSVSAASGSGGANASTTAAKPAGRGRVRDYTVLHPSCLSVCNVTIQDSIERSMDELITSTPPTDLRAVGRLRKKADVPPTKPNRFRTTQSKSKKETKLEFFGFEDKGDQEGEDGADPTAGGSSYKIKYFGFDDLSESDSDEEDGTRVKEKRKAKKAAAAAVAAMAVSVDSPQPSDSQDSQSSSNTDILEFSDDSNLGGSEEQKGRSGKQADTSKEIGRKIFSGPKKSPAKAVYNARHWNQPEPEEIPLPPLACAHTAPASISSGSSKDTNSHKDDGLFKAPPPPPKVIKSVTIPTQPYQDIVTALKCRKEHKELYTVVHNVKHFNDVVEFGENQEFTDDFEYLETGLKSSQPLNTRCLSIISLAARCAMPSFRMHLRARGKVAQVFKMLNDAPLHPNLALCTASLMYILSRDRLNMDLDRASLELMIRLLELEHDHSGHHQDQLTAKEMTKVKEKIRKLCETVHNKHLDLENITSCHLAMETLLSLTSKRAGDWFKEELRLLGGLDHIVDKVKECVQNLSQEDDKEKLVSSLWGAERCLRVLDSVTVQNPENQGYLIAYKDSQLIVSSARGLRYCEDMIQRYSREVKSSLCSSGTALPHCSFSNVGKAVEDCMRAVIGVLLNLTHDNEWGSTKTGEQDRLIITALNCVLRVPRYIPQEQRFDIRVLGLGLLINLVEYSARNRHCLVDMEFTSSTSHEGIQGEAGGEETQTPECIQGEAGGEETQTPEGIQGEAGGEETQTPEGIQGEAGGEETQTPEGIQGEAGGEETQTPEGIQGEAGGDQTPEGIQGEAGGEETQTPEGIQGEAGGEETQTPEGIQGEAGGEETQTPEGIQGEAGGEETQTPEGIQGEAGGEETQTPEGIQGEAGGDETQNPEQFLASTDPATAALTEGEAEKKTKGSSSSALAALVQFFLERERAAILAEAQTDDLISEPPKPQDQSGEWQETSGEIQWVAAETNDSENDKEKDIKKDEEDEELDLNKALQHAGKHMEDSIVASYTALLLGCLCQGSQVNVTTVRENLPKGDFSIMTEMLKKFLNFMNLTCAFGTTGHKSISRVIDYLDHC
ncbi:wings apart-like protein homolog [Salvelinus fontinalis]|uniref:wings apart-like protein homolog n=1 Tax=Salvelinus fontinalis TaxID=8038 RepID=UPI00248608B6|nr:wings apart-like protein homolog [Salvelinus fontinalis]XP_055758482.1 wings apart-like protein homolog [Salvelinus fontinalis]